jgi:hypothetical protein
VPAAAPADPAAAGHSPAQLPDKGSLANVPDASMLALFTGLVGFLTEEARQRGWADVTMRLRSVEQALAGPTGSAASR